MPRSVTILSTISISAAAAAAVLIFFPQSYRALLPAEAPKAQSAEKTPRRIKAKKPPNRRVPHEGDVDFDYIAIFRKCNAGDQAACTKLARREAGQDGDSYAAKAPSRAQMLATDNTPAPVYAPTVFNELMVKTSVDYASRIYRCRDQTCRNALGRDLEKRRIYIKTLADAKVACSRRQIEGCSIQADILEAGGELAKARDALRRGVELASSAVSRCDRGAEKDASTCGAGRTALTDLRKREKRVRERMLRVH